MTTKKSDKKNSKKMKKISSGSSDKEETEQHNEESAKAKKAKRKKPKFWKHKKKSTKAYRTPDEERIHKVEEISEETETKIERSPRKDETNKSVHYKKHNDKPTKVKRKKWKFLKRKKKDKKDNNRPDEEKEHADVPIFEEAEKMNEIVVECTRSLPSCERNETGHGNKHDDTDQDKKVKYSPDDEKKHANVEDVLEEVEKPRPVESTDLLLVNERDRVLQKQQEKPEVSENSSVRSKRIAKKTRQKHQYKNCGPCFSCRSSE